jgi:acetyl esterase/lipase
MDANRARLPMKSIVTLLAFVLTALPALRAAQGIVTTTYVYKTVGNLEIKLDAHRPNDSTIRPLAVWIHGGALINGGRQGIGRAGQMLLDAGYCVVSIDYRLAPETRLPGIIEDVDDAFRWLRENGREKLAVDPSKIAVLGGSAGGYLTLTSGFRVQPRPTVLVSFWGYGEVVNSWYADPSPHERHRNGPALSDAEMAAIEAGPPVANAKDRAGNGGAYYQMTRRLGVWPIKVSGCDPVKERTRFIPYMAAHNVTPDYPPTLLIHGTKDTDVPYEESQIMAQEFEKHRVQYRFITIEGGEHGLRGGNPADIDAAYAAVLPFVEKYMKR